MPDIVDTNVIATANFANETASLSCVEACINYLSSYLDNRYAVDSGNRIFQEYFGYASRSGQPNVGDAFAVWLWNNQGNINVCELVEITESGDEQILFNEIPFNDDLIGFDRADQKFLAVAIQCEGLGTIINATDSDWEQYEVPITRLGVQIANICSDEEET